MNRIFSFKQIAGFVIVALCFMACNSSFTPKPRGYYKISFPERSYQVFDQPGYPYTFEYPTYAAISRDSSFFEAQPENPYWINIDFPQFAGRIYLSYNEIGGKARYKVKGKDEAYHDSIGVNTFDGLLKGAYQLTFKHSSKASSINDSLFVTPNNIEGTWFFLGGNTATASQFMISDTVKHFLRGALYFDATPNADSLGIVNRFLQQDMRHLVNTLKWK